MPDIEFEHEGQPYSFSGSDEDILNAVAMITGQAPVTPTVEPERGYGLGQLAFDIPAAAARTVGGLVDLPIMAGEALAGALGYDVTAPRMSQMLSKDIEKFAQDLGVKPETGVQELTEFLIPVGKAKLGAQLGAGLLGYGGYKTGEAVGGDVGGVVGAVTAPLAGAGLVKAAPAITEKGKALQRAKFHARQSDYTSSRQAMLEVEEGKYETQLKRSQDNLIREKVLPATTNPETLLAANIAKQEQIEEQIINTLRNVDRSDVKVTMPSFNRANAYIDSNQVDITSIDDYKNIIKEFKNAVKNESKFIEPEIPTLYDARGKPIPKEQSKQYQQAAAEYQKEQAKRSRLSLDVLNKQRKVIGEKYKQGPYADIGFWREFYKDIKEHIEKYAPEVKELNRRKQDLIVTKPALQRAKGVKEEAAKELNFNRLAFTTGTLALPGLSYMTGSSAIGVPLGLALAGIGTKRGRQAIGRGLELSGSQLQNIDINDPLVKALQSAAIAQREAELTGE